MPLVKLGYLLIRTVAKPVASAIKRQARDHPAFRQLCVGVAQSYHRVEVKLKRGLELSNRRRNNQTVNRLTLDHHHPSQHDEQAVANQSIRPLDETKAVEVGSEFIGEALVFLVAGTLLVLDQLSGRQREQERRAEVERRFTELYTEIGMLKERVRLAEPCASTSPSPSPSTTTNTG
jgi:hypothetical protein